MPLYQQVEHQYRQAAVPLLGDSGAEKDNDQLGEINLHDDQLRLIFTCCHPALSVEAQVALTLKTIAGLSLGEISRAYLLPVKTLEQRITRAKRKIREACIAYEVPDEKLINVRLESVMKTIYLIYTQAYTQFRGADLIDNQLSEAAIYLAYMLNRLIRDNAEAQGLLALMLLQYARAAARVDHNGLPVPLEQQDRSLWDVQLYSLYMRWSLIFIRK